MKKLTKEQVKEMKELRKEGKTYHAIGDMFGVSFSTVYYWTKEGASAMKSQKSIERFRNLPEKQKKIEYKKRGVYFKSYFKNRYQNDPEFRAQHIQRVMESKKRRKEKDGKTSREG